MTKPRGFALPRHARAVLGLAAVSLVAGACNRDDVVDGDVADGNRAFAGDQFERAVSDYERALARRGEDPRVLYNLGTALYRVARQEAPAHDNTRTDAAARPERPDLSTNLSIGRSIGTFARAVRTSRQQGNTTLMAMSYFGLGNAYFRAQRDAEAVSAYQDALRTNPEHDDARHNLELALRRLDENRLPGSDGQTPRGHGLPQPGHERPQSEARGHDSSGSEPATDGNRTPSGNPSGNGDSSGTNGLADETPNDANGQIPGHRTGDLLGAPSADPSRDQTGSPTGDQSGDSAGNPADDGQSPAIAERALSNKLDKLERMSRDLRRRKLRSRHRGSTRGSPAERDW